MDGDTFEIGGENIRLKGIDAPEYGQKCKDATGKGFACGKESLNALKRIIGSSEVRCEYTSRGTYGRPLATCYAGEKNINLEMVAQGHAVAFVKYDDTYLQDEKSGLRFGFVIRLTLYFKTEWLLYTHYSYSDARYVDSKVGIQP